MAILDSQTRFQAVNDALTRETRASADFHFGRTSREVVGDLARQIEPTYEKVLSTGKASSMPLVGHVRNHPDTGCWLDHCFPIRNRAGDVQQLGLFVVNVTAERAAAEIFEALAGGVGGIEPRAHALLRELEQLISEYHTELGMSLDELVSLRTEPGRKAARFRFSVHELDMRIQNMRELVYAVTSHFPIPSC
jgi:hypothetical protein